MACRPFEHLGGSADSGVKTEKGAVANDSASHVHDVTVHVGPTAELYAEQRARIHGADGVRGSHDALPDPKISESTRVTRAS